MRESILFRPLPLSDSTRTMADPKNQSNFQGGSSQNSRDNHLDSSSSLNAALVEQKANAFRSESRVKAMAQSVNSMMSPENTIKKMEEFHGASSIYEDQPITLPGEEMELSSATYDTVQFKHSLTSNVLERDELSDSKTRQAREELIRQAQHEISEYYTSDAKQEQSMLMRYEELTNQKAEDAKVDPLVGITLAGKYKITGIVGKGAIATVYKAVQLSDNKEVAIKTLRNRGIEEIWRFNLEIESMQKMSQKNLVNFIDCIKQERGRIFLVMELVSGISLHDVLKIHGPITDEETVWVILKQVCDALTHAHLRKFIHRDLKTGNIVLSKAVKEPLLVKVLDFGLAKHKESQAKITIHGKTLGSPLYMSPEQCRGSEPTLQSDIYSLGIMAYEMLTGVVPYIGETIPEVMQAHCDPTIKPVPLTEVCPHIRGIDQLERIILKTLETDPSKRFRRVTRLKQALNFWIEGVRSGAYQESTKLDKIFSDDASLYNEIDQKVQQSITATMQLLPRRRSSHKLSLTNNIVELASSNRKWLLTIAFIFLALLAVAAYKIFTS